jgi:hypothetical protein
MSSERSAIPAPRAGRSWEWLFSQGLGFVCGQATVLLLAIGSVALAATRDGASAAIAMDDLRGFFTAPSAVHGWFYLLVPVLGLYALNTALATWRNVARKWRNGIRAPRFYAAAVIHVAFLTGLLAHAIGGLASVEGGRVMVGPGWGEIGAGRLARVTSLDVVRHADGSTKQIRADVEIRSPDGVIATRPVRYNGPISSGLGSDLLILLRPQAVPVLQLERGSDRCEVEVGSGCDLGGVRVELLYLHPPTQPDRGSFARVRIGAGAAGEESWLMPARDRRLADGSLLRVAGAGTRPGLLLQRRHAPGNPWALGASVLLAVGLALMWRRFLPAASAGGAGRERG